MLKTGVAAAILAGSSTMRGASEDGAIPREWIIVDGTNNSELNPETIAEIQRAGVSGMDYSKVDRTLDPQT